MCSHGEGAVFEFYAADLYRAEDGSFRVFRDYASSPAGLGYALENRIVMSRIFSALYHETQILRLAPFFQFLSAQFQHVPRLARRNRVSSCSHRDRTAISILSMRSCPVIWGILWLNLRT